MDTGVLPFMCGQNSHTKNIQLYNNTGNKLMSILPLLPCGCLLSVMVILATHDRKITITCITLWPYIRWDDNPDYAR